MPETHLPLRQPPLQSLATRIIFVVFLGTFLTAAVVSWISVASTFEFLRERWDRELPAAARARADALDAWLAEADSALGALAGSLPLRDGDATSRALADALPGGPFELLAWIDTRGEPLARAGSGRLPATIPPAPEGGRPVLRLAGTPPLPAAQATVSRPGRPATRLLGVVDRAALLRAVAPDGQTGAVHLLDGEGRVAWSSRDGVAGFRPPAAGPQPTSIHRAADGGFAISASAPLPALGWRLVVEQPFRVAFAPVFEVVTRVFVVDVGIVLLFSFLAYQITAAIVRPIEALSEGARRISEGRLATQIPEPRGTDELGLLTRTFNDMTRTLLRNQSEIHDANAKLKAQNEELRRANEVLEQLSITDGLTKLHNHRFFQDYLTREIKRVSRTGDPLAMLLIDIDDFKRLNDRLGHAAGDEMLVRVARLLNDCIRESDLAARYGGEEFVVLAPDTRLDGAVYLAEKIRTAIAESSFILDDSKQLTKTTVSIGVARYEGNRKTFFQNADQALYRAKAAGKNCVVADGDDRPRPSDTDATPSPPGSDADRA
jgi:diguanylate cyclase (GGDEF)-like protein